MLKLKLFGHLIRFNKILIHAICDIWIQIYIYLNTTKAVRFNILIALNIDMYLLYSIQIDKNVFAVYINRNNIPVCLYICFVIVQYVDRYMLN